METTLEELVKLAMKQQQAGDDGLMVRLAEINTYSEPERGEALRMLSQDYAGKRDTLNKSLDFNESQLQAEMPEGGVAGPSSNPFSIYVGANPLEHAAAGMSKYKAGVDRTSDRESLDKLSDEWGTQQQATMEAVGRGAGQNAATKPMIDALLSDEEYFQKYGRYRTVGA